MKIVVKDLMFLCNQILTKAEKIGLDEIEINLDYYWYLQSSDINNKKPELIVGAFVDDLAHLKKIISNKSSPTIVDFDRLGNTIKILGEAISKSDKIY